MDLPEAFREQQSSIDAPLDAEQASAFIDQFLTEFLALLVADPSVIGGSVHIHCGDVAGEWTIRMSGDGGFDVTREHAKGDCALRGDSADLLRVLWRREPLESIDVVGDAAVAQRFVDAPQFPA